jgi:lipoic acid synthetase
VERLPEWIKVRGPSAAQADGMRTLRRILRRHRLTTICQGAICPNAVECWSAKTATFLLLGEVCTRACRFCAVRTGDPGSAVDTDEPKRLASAVAELGLRYVVLTSVDRDDLTDGGAELIAEAVERIKNRSKHVRVEALLPDFSGNRRALRRVVSSGADVLGHNLETVRRLTPTMRDRRAGYEQSLEVLRELRAKARQRPIKSGLIVGLGETRTEISEALRDLRSVGVGVVTIGQYLRPTARAVPVVRYVSPDEFKEIDADARQAGFPSVLVGPLVRSSYRAAELHEQCSF